MREMGGRNDDRLGAASPSARFGRGFFSSINETVSIAGFAALGSAGFAASAVVSRDRCATAACDFRAASVCDLDLVGAGTGALFGFAGASTLALLVALCFDSGATAALTGLRAVAVLRAAVLVVVLVGIKFTHGPAGQARTILLRGRGLLVNGLMNLSRLRFIHGKNFDQVLDRSVA